MDTSIKVIILVFVFIGSSIALWYAVKGSINKRPNQRIAIYFYLVWSVLIIAGMIFIHPILVLLPLFIIAPIFLLDMALSLITLSFWKGIKLSGIYQDINDMGIAALFTGVFIFIIYFVAYMLFPDVF